MGLHIRITITNHRNDLKEMPERVELQDEIRLNVVVDGETTKLLWVRPEVTREMSVSLKCPTWTNI